jgi:hypothetical protein
LRSAEYFLHSAKYLLARLFGGYNAWQRGGDRRLVGGQAHTTVPGKMDDIEQRRRSMSYSKATTCGFARVARGNYDREIRSGSFWRPQIRARPPARDLDPKLALTAIDDEQGTATIAGVTATAW